MTDSNPMIEARGLSKHYGPFKALDDMSFKVHRGEVVAFLGPNGAGKSTCMKLLTGYMTPTSGSGWIGGFNVVEDRIRAAEMLGYLPENGPLYLEMTPRELLDFFASARGMSGRLRRERVEAVTDTCNLDSVLDKPIQKLSKGFRQRVGMAHVLLHEPDVVIMDEPTSGLDPNQVQGVRSAIRDLGRNKAVLLSTHILSEVEAVADRVVLIDKGVLRFNGAPADLRAEGGGELELAFQQMTGVH